MSGVGPKDHLTEKGIKVIADLPVGDNLQDPVAIDGLTFILEKPYSLLAARILSLPVVLNSKTSPCPRIVRRGMEQILCTNQKSRHVDDCRQHSAH